MKQVSLSGSPRENVGKKDAAALRANNRIPCVLYGGEEQTHFSVDRLDITKVIYSPDVYQINLDVAGKKVNAVMQEIQFHPVTDEILHVDFLQMFDDKPVKVNLPVRTKGNAPGVMMGGKLQQPFKKLRAEGLPKDLPEEVLVDITSLNIGDSVRVRDLHLEGLTFHAPQAAVVVGVKMARGAKKAEAQEG